MQSLRLWPALAAALFQVRSGAGTPCVSPAWTDKEIQIAPDIEFGSSYNRITKRNETLLLDVYMPPDSDTRAKRPAAVLVHGGSFESGDRRSDDEPELAMHLAKRGFFVVSVNYRLTGFPFPQALETMQPPLDAVEDVRAAVRFVRKNADQYRIDADRVLVGGDSAGAVTALYYGYVKEAQKEGNSGNPGYRSDVQLTIPVSGQLKAEAFCRLAPDGTPTTCSVNGTLNSIDDVDGSPGQPPMLMVHGTLDDTVPYVNAKAIYDRAQAVGLQSALITIPNAKHVPFKELFTEANYFEDFMRYIVIALKLTAEECPPDVEVTSSVVV